MDFKIGDEVVIGDGSFSMTIINGVYNTDGVHGIDKVRGTVIAINCRLPMNWNNWGGLPMSPQDGVDIMGNYNVYNDLLIQTSDGFVFTSSKHVGLVPPEYKVVIYGVEIDITEEQSKELAFVIGDLPGSSVRVIK